MPVRPNRTTDSPDADPDRRLVVLIKDSLHYRLRVLAAEQRTTIADVVREAIEREITRRREDGDPLPHRPPPADREIAPRHAAGTGLGRELSGSEPPGPGVDKLRRELDELRRELAGSEPRMRRPLRLAEDDTA